MFRYDHFSQTKPALRIGFPGRRLAQLDCSNLTFLLAESVRYALKQANGEPQLEKSQKLIFY
jgi:hypothetical protein